MGGVALRGVGWGGGAGRDSSFHRLLIVRFLGVGAREKEENRRAEVYENERDKN